jgi:pimeloyl-ACP methyl ester carboxylesterase
MGDLNEAGDGINRRDFLVAASTAFAGAGLLAGWPALAAAADSEGAAPAAAAEAPPVDSKLWTAAAGVTTGVVRANGLEFHYVEAGQGPLALCLHGFPDSPFSYRYLLPALAAAGYHAVAPYMRGYSPTGIPSRYTNTKDLAADVAGLRKALGGDDKAVLIAHDWGAVATYGAAQLEPTAWRRIVIMNIPPLAYDGAIMFQYPAIKREFYWWFFQMRVSNDIVRLDDFKFIDGIWADWSPGYDAHEDLPHAKDCVRAPANLEAALGYYRTFFNPDRFMSPPMIEEQTETWGKPITQQVLYMHGSQDGLFPVDADTLKRMPAMIGPRAEAVMIDGVGHFMLVEKPQEVNKQILRFLAS